jgi:hypothetical protein
MSAKLTEALANGQATSNKLPSPFMGEGLGQRELVTPTCAGIKLPSPFMGEGLGERERRVPACAGIRM